MAKDKPHAGSGSAAEYLGYEEYTPTGYTLGDKPIKRQATATQEWVIQDTGGVQFILKFDKNFVKKHLFTFSKKSAAVQHAADLLFDKDGRPKGKEAEYLLMAQLAALDAKLLKTLEFRAEEKTCRHCKDPATGLARFRSAHLCGRADCNHPVSTHTDDSGKCNAPGCTCTGVGADVYCPDGVSGAVVTRDAYYVKTPSVPLPAKPNFATVTDKKKAAQDYQGDLKKAQDANALRAKDPAVTGVKSALSTAKKVDTSRTYAAKRASTGKGDDPLAGASTAVNTEAYLVGSSSTLPSLISGMRFSPLQKT
jgi:hypothetical protein